MRETVEHQEILEGLARAEAFPFDAGRIEIVQTRISSVILAGDFAYKLKKPVRMEFLDFSSLEKRLHFCEREVDLNRRLAPDVYLGVVPVTRDSGVLRVEAPGTPLEYAVKMRRLPDDRMMNVLLEEERVKPAVVEEIATRVERFHGGAGSGPEISRNCEPGNVERELNDDLEQVKAFEGVTVSPEVLGDIAAYFHSWVQSNRGLLEERVRTGRIRDCHGDMHSRNICLPGKVQIFDCIEFNDVFRYIDVAREVAFLAMDLDSYDEPGLSKLYVDHYVGLSGDRTLPELLDFYKAWLALIRGKVYSIPADEGEVSVQERKHSIFRARRYFELAHRYAGGREEPIVLVLMGAMGTGKSALAQVLAKRLYVHMVDSDYVRKTLAGIEPEERRLVGFGEDIYSKEMTGRVYNAMTDIARRMVAEGYSVILEASFSRKEQREQVLDFASRDGTRLLFVYCTADMPVLEKRLIERERSGEGFSDGRLQLLPRQLEQYEEPDELPGGVLLKLDTDRPLEALADEVMDRIQREYGLEG